MGTGAPAHRHNVSNLQARGVPKTSTLPNRVSWVSVSLLGRQSAQNTQTVRMDALLAAMPMALNLVTEADVSASPRPGAAMQSHDHEIVAMIVRSSVIPEC